jgi:predicted RND superfamily exporter protein
MKKSKSTFLIILIVLLFASILLGYCEHIYQQDKSSIESLIANDQRFHDVQVTTKGIGIILEGHVKSKADLQSLYSEINRIKRGRVDSSVSVAEQ